MIDRDFLIEMLKQHVVEVKFTKADGTERVMNCTLKSDRITPYEKKTDRVKALSTDSDVVSVWDTEKDSWRSFKLSTLTAVNVPAIGQE
jgi:hypothetical protein